MPVFTGNWQPATGNFSLKRNIVVLKLLFFVERRFLLRRRALLTRTQLAALLVNAGFGIQHDDDLLTIAEQLGLDALGRTSLRNGRVAVAARH